MGRQLPVDGNSGSRVSGTSGVGAAASACIPDLARDGDTLTTPTAKGFPTPFGLLQGSCCQLLPVPDDHGLPDVERLHSDVLRCCEEPLSSSIPVCFLCVIKAGS